MVCVTQQPTVDPEGRDLEEEYSPGIHWLERCPISSDQATSGWTTLPQPNEFVAFITGSFFPQVSVEIYVHGIR